MKTSTGTILLMAILVGTVLSAQNGRKVSGIVVSAATQRPVVNARVMYEESGGSVQETVSDPKGRFEFSNGRLGTVTVMAGGFGTARRRWPPRIGRELRIGLVPPARIEGTVADIMTGRPVNGVVTLLVRHPHNIVSETVAVQNGVFRIGDMPPGPAMIVARASGFAPYFGTMTVEAGKQRDIRIRLFLEAVVAGHVVDSTGSAVESAHVAVGYLEATLGRGFLASAVGGRPFTDAEGAFVLNGLVPDVRIGLRAELDGRKSDVVTVTVEPGRTRQDVVLRLR